MDEQGLLDEITLPHPSSRVGPPLAELVFVRELSDEDVERILAEPATPAGGGRVAALKHSHHELARLIATGIDHTKASLMTGYSATYIGRLVHGDPLFGQLLDYYSVQREQVHIDWIQRMRALGLDTLDEIQRRVAEEPEKWTHRELMELEALLMKGAGLGAPNGGGGGPAAPVTVNVKFVQADRGPVIEHE